MIDPILNRFVESVAEDSKGVVRLCLFGSRARGDSRLDSDYDILVVVKERTRALTERLYDVVLDILMETGRLVSLKIYPVEHYERMKAKGTPFLNNVHREGVTLWTVPTTAGPSPLAPSSI